MQGSLQVNLGKLPKLSKEQVIYNFDYSGKQRFDLGFFASGQREQYVFGKRQLMAGPVSELGYTVHDFHNKAGFRMKSGEVKLSYKKGVYMVGEFNANLEAKMSIPKAPIGTPPRTLRIAAKGDFALDLGSRGSIMDTISKGWECQEYSFKEVKRHPENGVRHFKADRPIIKINFSEDLLQESINNESFKVGYPNAEGEFVTVLGRFINDKSKIQFVPNKGLRKGVRYTIKLKVGEQGVRSISGEFIDDDSGTGWHESEFWTSLPFANQNDESSGLSCDVYQTVKNAPLILGKPALMKVYADWPRLDDVHTSAQYREFNAKILNNSNDPSPVKHRFTRPDLMESWGKSVLREKEAAQYPFTPSNKFPHLSINVRADKNAPEDSHTSYSFKCPIRTWDRAPMLTADVSVIDPDDGNYAHQFNGADDESYEPLGRSALDALVGQYLQDVSERIEQLFPISQLKLSAPKYVELPKSGFKGTKEGLSLVTNANSKADIQIVVAPHEITGGGGGMRAELSEGQGLLFGSLSDSSLYYSRYVYIMVHEFGHIFNIWHVPHVEDGDSYNEFYKTRKGNIQKYEGLDGMKISKDGSLWWHKSSRLGNEESKHLAPLMYPYTLDATDVTILRHHYRQVQSLLEDLGK